MKTQLGNFLVSQPICRDPYFDRTVITVCAHNDQGAWGFITNKPIKDATRQQEVWQYLGWESGSHPDQLDLWQGGPVLPDRVIVIHTPDWQGKSTQELAPTVHITQDSSIFEAIHQGHGPSEYKIVLGFCGWSPGQLEGEQEGKSPWTEQHRWLTTPARSDLILSVEDQEPQWSRALELCARSSVDSWF